MSAKLPASTKSRAERRDPLASIFAFGGRQVRTGAMVGLAGTLFVHGAGAGQAVSSLHHVQEFVHSVRHQVRDRLRLEIDVDLSQPPPPPEPEKEPEPEPEPEPQPLAKEPPPEPAAPPPAAAQAANVLTAEADPNAPLDLTGDGFVVGTADSFAGGITASSGKSKTAVRDVRAAPTGNGKAPAVAVISTAAAPAADRSRRAAPRGNWHFNCGFPAEADAEGINRAFVVVSITVGANGRASSATVTQDPGSGFGRQARSCALRDGLFEPGLDSAGNPITQTVLLRFKFTR